MSLTDFVEDPDVRKRIDETFPNQGDRAQNSVKAEWQTNHYRLVGTAFDYLARFWLRNNIPEVHTRPWVAETSLELAEERFPDIVGDLRDTIERAKRARDDYLETGTVTRQLIESVIDLARIDGIYRGGQPPTDLGEYDDGDVADCLRLLEILDDCPAIEGDEAHLNPVFGLASAFVVGADADAILDGTFIDLKTTGKPTFKADYWRQLVGYLVLADAHDTLVVTGIYDQLGLGDDPEMRPLPNINAFGVYFARHGELSTVSTDVVYEADGYMEFRTWFVETAIGKYEPFDDGIRDAILMLF